MPRPFRYPGIGAAVLAGAMLGSLGCVPVAQGPGGASGAQDFEVVPFSARHAMALTALDVVAIMRAGNFTDEQIYELGPQVRRGLMTLGAAEVAMRVRRRERKVVVRFVVNDDDYVLVNSVASGYFVYDARNHRFGLREPLPQQPDAAHLTP